MILPFFQGKDSVSYSEQARNQASKSLEAQAGQGSVYDMRESIQDTFQAIERDKKCTGHEKAIARLGSAITSDGEIGNSAAITAGNALLNTITSAMPGTLGAILADTLRSADFSSSSCRDFHDISGYMFDTVKNGATSSDSEKKLASIGSRISSDDDLRSEDAMKIDYYLFELLNTLPAGPLGASLISSLAQAVPQKLSIAQSAPVGSEVFSQMKDSREYMERSFAGIGLGATSDQYMGREQKGRITSFLFKTLDSNRQGNGGADLLKALSTADYSSLQWEDVALIATEAFKAAKSDRSLPKAAKTMIDIGLAATNDEYMADSKKGTILYTMLDMCGKAQQGSLSSSLLDAFSGGDWSRLDAGEAGKILEQGFKSVKADSGASYVERSVAEIACRAVSDEYASETYKGQLLIKLLEGLTKAPQGAPSDMLLHIVTSMDLSNIDSEMQKTVYSEAVKKIAASPGAPRSFSSLSDIAAVIDKKEYTSDARKALMCSLLLNAAASLPKDASLLDILSSVDYSRLSWDDVPDILKEGFTQIEKDRSVPEVERTLARIALTANSLEVNEGRQGVVYYRMLSCMKSHGDGPLWEETIKAVMKSDLSKISWAEYRVIAGEVLKVAVSDKSTPDDMRAIAEKGRNASMSQVLDDERAGKMAFDALTEIYSYIRRKHEATQEIKEMAENVSDSKKPEKITVVEDDGSQFVEIDGIKLPVHETKSS
jgi:hypothetical protein